MRSWIPRSIAALSLVGALHAGGACVEAEPPPPDDPELYDLLHPPGFPDIVVPEDNVTTREGIALGRTLYYDKRLSPDASRACADCHIQAKAFSRSDVVGVIAHINLGWSAHFLWDGGFDGTLEEAMQKEVELFFETDVEGLREPDIEEQFTAAFGSSEITTVKAAYALAQFQRTMVSADSRFDRYLGGDSEAMSDAEKRGMQLFYSEEAECFHCHATNLFTDNLFHNIGLLADAEIAGVGRAHISGDSSDDGLFKTPTLRNVEYSAPYMHDDRFATLEEVVNHYSDGMLPSRTLDTLMPSPQGGGFAFTPEEKADLVSFMRSLSDEGFVANPDLAAP
ncbi:MAG: cytochrome-c peroxidase [Deltaproteobacteria bacterium]|nr:cytochrome-c peroxidase [Deltaproteobacteria bacterium]